MTRPVHTLPADGGRVGEVRPSRPTKGAVTALLEALFRAPTADAASAWSRRLAPGDRLGRFEIVREIGRGGFGVVYDALDTELGRRVALKRLRPPRSGEQPFVDWIRQEAEAVARLDHPCIVTLFDLGDSDHGPYLVEELLRGETLNERLARRGPFPARDALALGIAIASGIGHAHANGVLHRDLKPANVFLTDDGGVKLLDFGLAHLLGTKGTHGGGTPAYMAPEQARGDEVTARADVFALGAVLFEMLAGQPPFAVHDGRTAALDAAPLRFPRATPPALARVLARALAQEPAGRPANGQAMAEALRAAQRALGRSGRRRWLPATASGATRQTGNRQEPGDDVVCFDRYRLDPAQGLTRDGREVRLTPKALTVLRVLADRAGQVVTKEELFRSAWPDTAVSDSALSTCIQDLRHALGDDARQPRFIETLHRRGYRFLVPTTPGPPEEPWNDASLPFARPGALLVGREAVLERMLGACGRVERGSRQLLFVTGEPGIGKTTVVGEFLARATGRHAFRATWGQCVEHYGVGEPYQPLLEALSRLCRRQPGGDEYVEALLRFAPSWLAQLPGLVPDARQARLQRAVAAGIAGTTRERMLRELTEAVEAMTARAPLVFCLEDLHWSDASTLDWIAAFAQRPEPARALIVATYRRSEVEASEHPLAARLDGLRVKGFCHEIALGGLDEGAVGEYVALRFPAAPGSTELQRRLARSIQRHTGGNPLFVVNVLGDLVGRGLLVERDREWTVCSDLGESDLGIPDDVRRTIERQVDRLSPAERGLLEVASVAGASFSAAAVAAGARAELDGVETTLTALARHDRLLRETTAVEWPDGTLAAGFEFLHAVYRDVLYRRIPAGRRAILHRQVGAREESAYGERAREIAAELAMHFEQSRDLPRATTYLEHAALNARRRGAYKEARMLFERALALLEGQPGGRERTEREVALRIGLGGVQMATLGWGAPEVEESYVRARALCRQLGDTPRLFPALWGLWLFYWGRGPLSTAHELVESLLALAGDSGDDALGLQAHHAAWATAFSRGEFEAALVHTSAGLALYDADRHGAMAETYGSHDAANCGRCFRARALAFVGRTEEGARSSHEAIASARAMGDPFSLALAHVFAAAVDQTRRDAASAREHAEAGIALAREQDFRFLIGWASALAGWASLDEGRGEEGRARIQDGIARTRATGTEQFLPHLLGLLAEAELRACRVEPGLAAIDEALAIARRTGERFYEAELHRLRGELLLAAGSAASLAEAERSFADAIAVGRSQGAKLLVLRTAVSAGRLWGRLGRGEEARQLVDGARRDLDEPLGSPDAKDADAVLGA